MMTAVNPLFVFLILALGIGISFLLSRRYAQTLQHGGGARFVSIDGLRGYLAFFVFLHHSCVWYFFIQTGRWEIPPSNLYTMLGQGGVALFFMVTSFLFFNKLLESRGCSINWFDFYAMRIARLVPLYLVAFILLLLFVCIRSNWMLTVPLVDLLGSIFKWLLFTVSGKPDINAVAQTSIMMASVTWSLPFEWFFYFGLPIFAVFLSRKISLGGIIFAALALYIMLENWSPAGIVLRSFLGGVIAAFAVRQIRVKEILVSRGAAWLTLPALLMLIQQPTAFNLFSLFLLSLIFTIVASGNNLFGILDNVAARWMGELSYGIYLFHGLAIFGVFYFVLGLDFIRRLSSVEYWVLIGLLTPVVLSVAHFLHLIIERPALKGMQTLLRRRCWTFKKRVGEVS